MRGHSPTGRAGRGTATDDVAQNIRTEQNAAAAPSREEVARKSERAEAFHAEITAVKALIDALDVRNHVDIAFAIAEHCGFDSFDQKAGRVSRWHQGQRGWKEMQKGHLEAHEIPDREQIQGQTPPAAMERPFPVTDSVRERKAEAWAALTDPDETLIETERLDAGGAVRYRVTVTSPKGTTTTQLIEERED